MVRIVLPVGWTEGRRTEFETAEGLLPDVIRRFADDHPKYRHRVLGPDSQLLRYVNFCVDDDVVPRHLGSTTMVRSGSTVVVMAPMAGG